MFVCVKRLSEARLRCWSNDSLSCVCRHLHESDDVSGQKLEPYDFQVEVVRLQAAVGLPSLDEVLQAAEDDPDITLTRRILLAPHTRSLLMRSSQVVLPIQ